MLTRRDSLKLGVLGGCSVLVLGNTGLLRKVLADDDLKGPRLTPFLDALPLPPAPKPVAPFRPVGTTCDTSNALFFRLVEEEALVSLHSQLPPTRVWRYRDTRQPANSPFAAGPTFKVKMGPERRTIIVRHKNRLPRNHIGFGVPRSTVHLHGAHVEARSDGFPENIAEFSPIFEVGQRFDYCYEMQDPGFSTGEADATERPSTMWYHDHLLDFTGPNVVRGLAGFYLVYDDIDTGDEKTGLKLPSGEFDIPLNLQDRLLDKQGRLVYLPGSHDGFLGNQFMVNGVIQPYLKVKRRKYRFRFLNGSNARFYMLNIVQWNGKRVRFDHIATEGGLFARPIRDQRKIFLGMAERNEIVIDFSKYAPGTELFLTNVIRQDDGRGPAGNFNRPATLAPRAGTKLLKFIVTGDAVKDNSEVPDTLRPFRKIRKSELAIAHRHHFAFERRRGAWVINGNFIDIDTPVISPPANTPQIWTFKNQGGGWWHPIHVHLEFMRILKRNGKRPPLRERDGMARKDTITLGPNDEVQVYLKFRDYPGPWVFHCHNIEHEDMFMMARFDVI